MDAINLVITVCAVLAPANCEEKNLVFSSTFSLQQCADGCSALYRAVDRPTPAMDQAVKWRCEYPHSREKI